MRKIKFFPFFFFFYFAFGLRDMRKREMLKYWVVRERERERNEDLLEKSERLVIVKLKIWGVRTWQ